VTGVKGRDGRACAAVLSAGLMVTLAFAMPGGASVGTKPSAKDVAILDAGVITATDVPSSWISSRQPDTDSKDFEGISACKQIRSLIDAAKKSVPRMLSPMFSDPASSSGATRASDTVLAFKSVGAANKYLRAFQSPDAGTCYRKALEHTNSASGLQVSPIPALQGTGDANAGYEVTASVVGRGQRLAVYFDVLVIRVGRAIVAFQFVSVGARIAQGPTIINTVIKRVSPLAR
jgi:hypothetical protein